MVKGNFEYSTELKPSILPSLSLIDIIYCRADIKATAASIFKLIFVFGSTDRYGL
jgi:hypothetical protein